MLKQALPPPGQDDGAPGDAIPGQVFGLEPVTLIGWLNEMLFVPNVMAGLPVSPDPTEVPAGSAEN
jgi:hypothetical protein